MRLQNMSGDGSIFIAGAGGEWGWMGWGALAGMSVHKPEAPDIVDCRRLPEPAGPGIPDQFDTEPREASSGLSHQ